MNYREKQDKIERAAFERFKMMPHLQEACNNCKMCSLGWAKAQKDPGGSKLDPHVFSNYHPMNRPARFMIVGQNPGWNEIEKGEPFVGQSGDNFEKAIEHTLYNRRDFYITNAVKCYTHKNKKPDAKSLERCEPFLRMEIAIVKPILVIAFGSVAFDILCPGVDYNDSVANIVTSEKFDVKVYTVYHPSPLNLAKKHRKEKFFKDMKMLGRIMDRYLTPF